MNDKQSLTQLAAEVSQLRRQIEQVNERLDKIYGALARLSEGEPAKSRPASQPSLSATASMTPGGMLTSLHQFAVASGLNISPDVADRLPKGANDHESS